jgi:hypothetical protein
MSSKQATTASLPRPGFAEATWRSITAGTSDQPPPVFDPATLESLPEPAKRLLTFALPPGTPLVAVIELAMHGEIELGGRWLPFIAEQVLQNGIGFVWNAEVGGRWLRFTGADALGPGEARMEFRLHGRIPIVRAADEDVRRSARGRLAGETVAWLPQALTPQLGARWSGIDDERATVTLDVDGTDIPVEVAVAPDGRLRWLVLQRWNASAKPPAPARFGGTIDDTHTTAAGVRIAGAGTVGWNWHPEVPNDGVFFRYRIDGDSV